MKGTVCAQTCKKKMLILFLDIGDAKLLSFQIKNGLVIGISDLVPDFRTNQECIFIERLEINKKAK